MRTATRGERLQQRKVGVLLAAGTAVISGIAIFVNGYGVRAWTEISDATTYTTLKNSVAAVVLLVGSGLLARRSRAPREGMAGVSRTKPGLVIIAVVGGSIPFVLFFEGLARATSADAAFIHKTLMVWVTFLAVLVLREKIGALHIAAIAMLIGGQVALSGGIDAIEFGAGEWMILAATLLWAVETVVAKRVLVSVPWHTVGAARMAGGAALLVLYGVGRGGFAGLTGVTTEHVVWILLTGLTLSAYVATWFAALSRAPAVDVTAVLAGGAIITALLDLGLRGVELPPVPGLVLVALGAIGVVVAGWRRRAVAR